MSDSEHFLRAILGRDQEGWLELRWAQPDGRAWRSGWYSPSDVADAAAFAIRSGAVLDVYAGMAPRVDRRGISSNVERAWLVSADCDTDESLDSLAEFPLAATMVIESGGRTQAGRAKLHAHWALTDPIGRIALTNAKRRLAQSLNSDRAISDASRVMRVPGTRNHKPGGGIVRLIAHDLRRRYPVEVFLAELASDIQSSSHAPPTGRDAGGASEFYARVYAEVYATDPVMLMEPAEWVARFTGGTRPAANRKIRCPLPGHDDRTPSMHVYDEAYRGVWCYGCSRGGDVYRFAAHLWELPWPLEGEAFREFAGLVRERLFDGGAS